MNAIESAKKMMIGGKCQRAHKHTRGGADDKMVPMHGGADDHMAAKLMAPKIGGASRKKSKRGGGATDTLPAVHKDMAMHGGADKDMAMHGGAGRRVAKRSVKKSKKACKSGSGAVKKWVLTTSKHVGKDGKKRTVLRNVQTGARAIRRLQATESGGRKAVYKKI